MNLFSGCFLCAPVSVVRLFGAVGLKPFRSLSSTVRHFVAVELRHCCSVWWSLRNYHQASVAVRFSGAVGPAVRDSGTVSISGALLPREFSFKALRQSLPRFRDQLDSVQVFVREFPSPQLRQGQNLLCVEGEVDYQTIGMIWFNSRVSLVSSISIITEQFQMPEQLPK